MQIHLRRMTERDSDALSFAKDISHHYVSVKVFWFSSRLAIVNLIWMANTVQFRCHTDASSNSSDVFWYRHLLHLVGVSFKIGTFAIIKQSVGLPI